MPKLHVKAEATAGETAHTIFGKKNSGSAIMYVLMYFNKYRH
jgi:hypothetical protein